MKKLNNLLQKWPRSTAKHTTSTKKPTAATTLPPLTSRIKTACVQLSLYSRCDQLPLSRFITCICGGNLTPLRKHPFVTKKLLNTTWNRIIEEYSKLTGDAGYEKTFRLSKDIARENVKLLVINACLKVLSVRYSQQSVDCLRQLGYCYRFDQNDMETYRFDLERVRKKARMITVEIEEKTRQYKNLTSPSGGSASVENFTQTLVLLSKYMGYRISAENITVSEYVTISKQYKKEIDQLSAKKSKPG